MRVLVTAATGPEMKVLKEQIKSLKIKDLDVQFLATGIGMYETVFSLTRYLTTQSVDFILNIGVCGYTEKKEKLIQIGRIVNATTKKESLVPVFVEFAKIESIWCSEVPVTTGGDFEYVDMESRAIEYVAQKFQIPRIIVKVPVDKVGGETVNFDRGKALESLREHVEYKKLFLQIIDYIQQC